MVYKNLNTDERIKKLLADIAKKMRNDDEKKEFLASLGYESTKEILLADQKQKEQLTERLIHERAKRFTAADVSFQL